MLVFRFHVCVCMYAWASESTSGLLLCGSLQHLQCIFFVSVFVSVVFYNSEVPEPPDMLLPVSMTTKPANGILE